MVKYELLGKYLGQFTDSKSGELIKFCRFYAQRLDPPEGVVGLMTEEIKVPLELYESLDLGSRFFPIYNKFGRLEGFGDA